MADRTVRISISAEDKFSQVFAAYAHATNQAVAETQNLNNASAESAGGVGNLAGVVKDAVVGFIAFKAVGLASELVAIGNKANITHAAFESLSGGAANATRNIQLMRDATGGIVSDTDLIMSANKMLEIGLASTGAEAAKFSGTAIALGQALGRDAAESVSIFTQMLAVDSTRGLAKLGLSATNVKERMAELDKQFPGMTHHAEFMQATMEEAAKTTAKLGGAIDAARNPIARLETSFDNLKETVGSKMADIVNTAMTTGDQLLKIFDAISKNGIGAVVNAAVTDPAQVAAQRRAAPLADQGVELFSEYLDMSNTDLGPKTGNELQDILNKAFAEVEANPDLKNHWDQVASDVLGYPFDPTSPTMTGLRDSLSATYALVTSESAALMGNQANELKRFQAFAASQVGGGLTFAQMQAQNQDKQKYGAMTAFYGGSTGGVAGQLSNFFGANDPEKQAAAWDKIRQNAQDAADAQAKLSQFQGGVNKFLDPKEFDDIKSKFEELQQLNEQGLISDDSLSKARDFKDQAEAAANAFKNMSLTDIFGQTSGGIKGEIGDQVIAAMKKSGASDEAIAAAQQNFNLGSGRETSASVAMQSSVAPMIANLAPGDQQKAIDNVNAFLELAAKMNLNPDQIAAGLPGAAGIMPGGKGQSFSIKPGQTPGEIAAALGVTVDQLLAAVGAPNARSVQPGSYNLPGSGGINPNFNPQTYAQGFQNPYETPNPSAQYTGNPFLGPILGGGPSAPSNGGTGTDPVQQFGDISDKSADIKNNMEDVSSQFDEINTKADQLNSVLDIAAGAREVKFTANLVDNTKGLLQLLINQQQLGTINTMNGGAFSQGGTRDNGGRVAGVVPSSNQRGRITG